MADNRSQLPRGNRSQFEELVCDGLGYCCPYAFLRMYKQTGQIAARLGCADRTVRRWKAKFNDKEIGCEEQGTLCMLATIRAAGK